MKIRKIAPILGASVLAFGAVLAPTMPVLAAGNGKATGGAVNIQKYLVIKSTAEVPNIAFQFTIAGASVANGTVENGFSVYSGNDTSRVTGTPTVGSAVFKNGDTKYDAVQDLVSTGIQVKEGAKDPVKLSAGQSYARTNVTVDFSGVSFSEPGVYRYVITETADATGTVTNDATTTRYVDVYVSDEDGTLGVLGYVLHGEGETKTVKRYVCTDCGAQFETNRDAIEHVADSDNCHTYSLERVKITNDAKSEGFVNKMEAKDLKIAKQVTGNQASRTEYFKFTLNITKGLPNTTYSIDLSHADSNAGANTNPTSVTTDGDGNASVDVYLKHDQYVTVRSLNIGSAYTVSEDKTAMADAGYTTEIVNADDTDGVSNADFSTNGAIDTADADEISVSFTNKRSGTIPTGVVMTVAPFAAVTLLGVAGVTTIVMKKRKQNL